MRFYVISALLALAAPCLAQKWDLPARGADYVSRQSEGKLKLSFEYRYRYESREGVAFGREPDVDSGLSRLRFGAAFKPVSWLKFSGMVQDSRAPGYGPNAPSTVRDQADLQEGYVELFPEAKKGFGMTAGRLMLNYGEARLIGSPQWGNVSRTWDHGRVYYRTPRAQFEFLAVSPVKIRLGEFNRPVFGDRIWGTYNSFPNLWRKSLLEAYVLQHDQNRPGGFTAGSKALHTDTLGTTTYGGRFAGPITRTSKFSLEGALQSGHVGPASHRAGAWFSSVSRRWTIHKRTLDISAEYKYASGTANPANTSHVSTFDQLYPANHDKFGHEDLIGWRNIQNARSLTTYALTKSVSVNFMYDAFWLASLKDALYNGSGKAIVRSATGTAGRFVGQETDLYFTWKYRHFAWGAGGGYFFNGPFVRNTTPNLNPVYAYVFGTYAF